MSKVHNRYVLSLVTTGKTSNHHHHPLASWHRVLWARMWRGGREVCVVQQISRGTEAGGMEVCVHVGIVEWEEGGRRGGEGGVCG